MSSTLSCDKGGFNGVERFPRVNSKCPNNAMKSLLVYLLITTQPCFSEPVSAPQYVSFPVEKAHRDVSRSLKIRICKLCHSPSRNLNMVFLISSCTFTSTLLYPGVVLALMSVRSSRCLSPKCFKTPPQPYVSLSQFWSGMKAHLM